MTLLPPTGKIYWDEIVEWDIKINKMKSYTDIEQSKKLAEILPLETADMFWLVVGNTPRVHVLTEPLSNYSRWENYPCWSLAALLAVLPEINGVNLKFERVKAEDGYDGYYYHIEYENKILIPYSKNPVDACVEMIIKLHEQKLL